MNSELKKQITKSDRQIDQKKFYCGSSNRGSSLLEMAFVIPALLTLMVGVIEIGRFASFSILVANAARSGVQYGAQSLVAAADTTGIRAAALDDGQNVTGLTVSSATHFCSCSNTPTTHVTCPATCTSPAHPLVYVDVTTSGTFSPIFHYPGLPTSFTVARESQMRVAQ